MLSITDFEVLIKNPESSTLDFKSKMYEFSNDSGKIKTGKFVKDILSFCNTVRNETSYIVIGIQEEENQKILVGIDNPIDDAILQDKVKDKIFPRAHFNFYTIKYKNKSFGILEFPVERYPMPIYSTIKMKGLEIGRIYRRKGTSNTEAIGQEIITINNWLQSIPEIKINETIHDHINLLIKKLISGEEKLSAILTDIHLFARRNELIDLTNFCSIELKGIIGHQSEIQNNLQYRVQTLKVSLDNIEINTYSYLANENSLKTEMKNSKDFFDFRMMFPHPINQIESHMNGFNSKTLCTTIKMNSNKLFQEEAKRDYKIIGYIFKDDWSNLYRNIRQQAIDKLMEI